MSILTSQDLEYIQSAEDLHKIFIKLGYEDAYAEIDVEDLELTDTQASAVYRTYLIGSYEKNSLQVILFELKWNKDHILRQRLQAIAKNLSQRPTLFIVLGTTDYETLSLINVGKKFDEKMNLLSLIKEARINLNNPSTFDVNHLESLATKERQSKEIYEAQRQIIQYSIHRTREKEKSLDAIGSYLRQIGRIPLLKSEKEITLARQIKPLLNIEEERNTLKENLQREPTEEELSASLGFSIQELRRRIYDGRKAKDKLITANLRLVVSNAKKYTGRSLDLLDLIQEGNLGLIRATEKFEPAKGNKFSTYATWWIRQAITRAIQDKSRIIRIPVHYWEKYYKLKNLLRPEQSNDYGNNISIKKIAAQLEMTVDKIILLKRRFLTPISIDILIKNDPSSTLLDFISQYHVFENEKVFNEIFCEQLFDFYRFSLTLKERQIIKYRFGFFGNKLHTLQEVGIKYGLTRERIRQIETKSLNKIKANYHDFSKVLSLEEIYLLKLRSLSLRTILGLEKKKIFKSAIWDVTDNLENININYADTLSLSSGNKDIEEEEQSSDDAPMYVESPELKIDEDYIGEEEQSSDDAPIYVESSELKIDEDYIGEEEQSSDDAPIYVESPELKIDEDYIEEDCDNSLIIACRIFEMIKSNPGIRAKTIGKKMGLTRQTINCYLYSTQLSFLPSKVYQGVDFGWFSNQ